MHLYQDHIQNLIHIVNQNDEPGTQFLTCYFKSKNRFKEDDLKRLKSQLLTGLKRHNLPDTADTLHQDFINQVMEQVKESESLHAGLAIFARFQSDTFEVDDVVFLHTSPKKELFVGEVYDLDQLLWLNETTVQSLIIKVARDYAELYQKTGRHVKKLQRLENPYLVEIEKQYLEKHAPDRQEITMHRTGGKNLQKRQEKENAAFLDIIGQKVRDWAKSDKTFDMVIVFHSSEFDGHLDHWIKDFKKDFRTKAILTKNLNLQDWKELSKAADKLLDKYFQNLKTSEFEAAKENHFAFLDEWEAVNNAALEKRVRILFIPPSPQENRDTLARIVHSVAESGGRVFVMENQQLNSPISATLRY